MSLMDYLIVTSGEELAACWATMEWPFLFSTMTQWLLLFAKLLHATPVLSLPRLAHVPKS
jgi:hypothetical protein